MDISVIIVNYNVKHFLEQCICSLLKALETMTAEVIVVDNFSGDGSVEYLQKQYPSIKIIRNLNNEGFGKANNKALAQAKGNFILFLNPDTILSEKSIRASIGFMQNHTDAGALGIRMIDGSGKYLPESKRGFPGPWVSFCKMTGLTKLFPHSARFAGYYLGHLSPNSNQEIEALAGAFMLIRKEVLDRTGGFDEQFFMYAEDIDLSYRIRLAGYKNYYFAEETIIHFKGESTSKDAAYIRNFYGAMVQFVNKHYKSKSAVGAYLLNSAIKLRAGLARLVQSKTTTTRPQKQVFSQFDLQGDPESVARAREKFTHTPGAPAIILCIGPQFGYSEAFAQMEKLSGTKFFFIHGDGSRSAVGSNDSNRQGLVLGPF